MGVDQEVDCRYVVCFGEAVQKRGRWIDSVTAEDINIQQMQQVEVDCCIQPVPFRADLDSGLVDGDPRWVSPRRVRLAVGQAMRPLPNRAVRALDCQQFQNGDGLPDRLPRRVETHPERPDGSRRALVLPNVLVTLVQRFGEEVYELHGHFSLRPPRFSNSLN